MRKLISRIPGGGIESLTGFTGYEGNSQLLIDEATVFDFGMQMAHRTFDDIGVHQVKEPNEVKKAKMIDNLWFEKRDESTQDKKTHDAKFHKDLPALFKETEEIKQTRTYTTVLSVATLAVDSQTNMVSPTLVLLTILARDVAREIRANPEHSYKSWHEVLQETLAQVAERTEIPFANYLYIISPFWVSTIVQCESGLDEQQMKLYIEAMQRATITQILA